MASTRLDSGTIELPTLDDTIAWGTRLGAQLRAGDVVVLSGPLGAGKTALAKGIAVGMDVEGPVNSPTFVLARLHRARRGGHPAMVHVDFYRLLDSDGLNLLAELDSLDLDTDLEDAVVVVEWGEGLAERLSQNHLDITLHRSPDSEVRAATWRWHRGMRRTVLAIDTATPAVTAAVVAHETASHHSQVLAQRLTLDARAHAEMLTPNVVGALADAGLTMPELDGVVVGCGPGPFTGLRVGMATAAAYGHALGVPVYGVCTLDAIGVETRGEVLVVTDARRREVYWARYRDGVRIEGPDVSAAADVAVGDAEAVAGSPEHAALFDLPRLDIPYPSATGLVAAVPDWTGEPAPLVPMYLRRPDAKTLAERGVLR